MITSPPSTLPSVAVMIICVVALAVINFVYKGFGPALLGSRQLPARVTTLINALPSALLGALLTVDLLGPHWQDLDWTLAPGLTIAIAARTRGWSHLVCIMIAIAATGATRGLTT